MRSIAVLNQKGGVGKTTSTVNIGAGLAERGQRVLLLDMDPQAHLTLHLGLEPAELEYSVYDTLTAGVPLSKILVRRSEQLHIAPSHINLAGAEIELVNTIGRESLLRDAVAELADQYDYLLIDCPPSLGMLSLNALVACQEVFVPLQTHFLAMQGMSQLLETVQLVNRRLNPRLRVSGIIFCQYDRRTSLSREVVEEVRSHFTPRPAPGSSVGGNGVAAKSPSGPTVFETHIRQTVRLAEAPSFGKSIFEYDRNGPGAADYNRLVLEVLRQGGRTVDLNDPLPLKPTREPEASNSADTVKPTSARSAATAEPIAHPSRRPAKPGKPAACPGEVMSTQGTARPEMPLTHPERRPKDNPPDKPTDTSTRVSTHRPGDAGVLSSTPPETQAQPTVALQGLGDPGEILRCQWQSEPIPVLPAKSAETESAQLVDPEFADPHTPAVKSATTTEAVTVPPGERLVLEVASQLPTARADEDTVQSETRESNIGQMSPPAQARPPESRLPSEGGCDCPGESDPPSDDLAGLPDPEILSEAEEAKFLAGLEHEHPCELDPAVPAAAG